MLALIAVAPAQIAISVSGTYEQNFDSLGPATVPWSDGFTLPGWYAGINSNATADGNLTISDGSNGALTGLLNLGTASAADRALGSKVTGTGSFANIAFGVLFQNTSGLTLDITNITYTGELWRTNSGGVAEQWVTFYKVSPSLFTDTEPGGSSATASAGTFNALTNYNWSSPTNTPNGTQLDGNLAANRRTIGATLDPNLVIAPGNYFMFRWVDPNLANTDGHQGIDDFSITFNTIAQGATLTYDLGHGAGGAPDGVLEVSAAAYWLNAGNPSGFAVNDVIEFSQPGSATIDVPADVVPFSTTVSAPSGIYTIGGAGKISGPLVKSGAGSVVFTSANTFSSTALSGGTIVTQAAGALGNSPLSVLGAGGTLQTDADLTVPDLGGDGRLVKTGAGTLTLTAGAVGGGASGGVTVRDGKISLSNLLALGGGAQAVTLENNGGIEFTHTGPALVFSETANPRSLIIGAGGGRFSSTQATGATASGVTISRASAISGAEPITKQGEGVLRISAAQTTFSGNWVVEAGALEVSGSANALGSGAVRVNGGVFVLNGTAALTLPNDFTLAGGALGTRTGDLAVYGGNINVLSDSGIALKSNSTPTGQRSLTISGVISGSGSLNVTGPVPSNVANGVAILTNVGNTYSGDFHINSLQTVASQPAGGAGSTLGAASVTLAGGILRIRDDGSGDNGTLAHGNDVTVVAPSDATNPGVATINVDRSTGGASVGNTVRLGSLNIGAQTLNGAGANGYRIRFDDTTLTGDATINTDTADIGVGVVSGAFGLTKEGAGTMTIGGASELSSLVINAGKVVVATELLASPLFASAPEPIAAAFDDELVTASQAALVPEPSALLLLAGGLGALARRRIAT
jgi:autotransporter-associated beta strand protein